MNTPPGTQARCQWHVTAAQTAHTAFGIHVLRWPCEPTTQTHILCTVRVSVRLANDYSCKECAPHSLLTSSHMSTPGTHTTSIYFRLGLLPRSAHIYSCPQPPYKLTDPAPALCHERALPTTTPLRPLPLRTPPPPPPCHAAHDVMQHMMSCSVARLPLLLHAPASRPASRPALVAPCCLHSALLCGYAPLLARARPPLHTPLESIPICLCFVPLLVSLRALSQCGAHVPALCKRTWTHASGAPSARMKPPQMKPCCGALLQDPQTVPRPSRTSTAVTWTSQAPAGARCPAGATALPATSQPPAPRRRRPRGLVYVRGQLASDALCVSALAPRQRPSALCRMCSRGAGGGFLPRAPGTRTGVMAAPLPEAISGESPGSCQGLTVPAALSAGGLREPSHVPMQAELRQAERRRRPQAQGSSAQGLRPGGRQRGAQDVIARVQRGCGRPRGGGSGTRVLCCAVRGAPRGRRAAGGGLLLRQPRSQGKRFHWGRMGGQA
jgi:hypothetical protein